MQCAVKKQLSCKKCNKKFLKIEDLNQHEKTCLKSQVESSLSAVKDKIQGQKSEDFNCQKCDKVFNSRFQLNDHTCPTAIRSLQRLAQGDQNPNNEKPLDCQQCDKKFSSLEKLNEHNMSHICEHYKKGLCKFGSRGKNSQGQCQFKHPRPCWYNETPNGCKKGENCDFLHRVRKVTDFNGNGPNHLGAHHVTRGARSFHPGNGAPTEKSFLGEGRFQADLFQFLDQYFQQRMGQNQHNNGPRGSQWHMTRR